MHDILAFSSTLSSETLLCYHYNWSYSRHPSACYLSFLPSAIWWDGLTLTNRLKLLWALPIGIPSVLPPLSLHLNTYPFITYSSWDYFAEDKQHFTAIATWLPARSLMTICPKYCLMETLSSPPWFGTLLPWADNWNGWWDLFCRGATIWMSSVLSVQFFMCSFWLFQPPSFLLNVRIPGCMWSWFVTKSGWKRKGGCSGE